MFFFFFFFMGCLFVCFLFRPELLDAHVPNQRFLPERVLQSVTRGHQVRCCVTVGGEQVTTVVDDLRIVRPPESPRSCAVLQFFFFFLPSRVPHCNARRGSLGRAGLPLLKTKKKTKHKDMKCQIYCRSSSLGQILCLRGSRRC